MALARALAVDPQVLLLDEPFGALDAKVRADLRQWLRRLHDEVHVTTVLVTHDQEEALDVADRIAVLNKGRIEQVGDPDDALRAARQRLRHVVPRLGGHGSAASWCARTTSCSSATAVAGARRRRTVAGSPGVVEAVVERVVRLGFEVRVDLRDRPRRAVRRAGHPRRRRGAGAAAGRDGPRHRPCRAPGGGAAAGGDARRLTAPPSGLAWLRCAIAPECERGHLRAHRVRHPGHARPWRRRSRRRSGPVSVDTLATRQDLPRKFLEAIVGRPAPRPAW